MSMTVRRLNATLAHPNGRRCGLHARRGLCLFNETVYGVEVPETQNKDGQSQESDSALRLRVAVFDALMAAKGIHTVVDQAKVCGVHRSTLFRIRAGSGLNLKLAMAMAQECGTSIENLFEQAQVAA